MTPRCGGRPCHLPPCIYRRKLQRCSGEHLPSRHPYKGNWRDVLYYLMAEIEPCVRRANIGYIRLDFLQTGATSCLYPIPIMRSSSPATSQQSGVFCRPRRRANKRVGARGLVPKRQDDLWMKVSSSSCCVPLVDARCAHCPIKLCEMLNMGSIQEPSARLENLNDPANPHLGVSRLRQCRR